jgi:hypothetical protein
MLYPPNFFACNFHRRALTQKERQALEAAEEARKEQVLLACARRDSSRAAAEMQRRHLEAAVQLEGPNSGGAVHATYEAVKEEKVLKLSTETLQKEHLIQSHDTAAAPVSPRRPPSATISTTNNNATFITAPEPEPLLRETCNAVVSEVESRLERWKEQLYMQEREGSNNTFTAPPVGEPSLAPPSTGTDDELKLLRGGSGGGGRRSRSGDYSESWPGIFSFPSK